MRIFVTGRSGQLARSLIESGSQNGVEVISAGRPLFDLRDARSVAQRIADIRPGVVVNAAAYTQVDKAESDEAEAFAVNAEGAANVAKACMADDIPLIHISTDFVFEGGKDGSYTETDPTGPLNAYGRSKLEGERQVAALCPRHLIVRTSWVYSPWGQNFVLTMLRLAKERAEISVVEDQHGNPTYAPHLADVLVTLARRAADSRDGVPWGTYHAAGRGSTSWCGLAREVFDNAAKHSLPAAQVRPIASADYPTAARRPLNSKLDTTALRDRFQIVLPEWQIGVRECVLRVAQK